jgi:hypothetical protein
MIMYNNDYNIDQFCLKIWKKINYLKVMLKQMSQETS